jgi:transposase-like protein
VRRAIYTTNAIESLNMTLRKISKNRALFPATSGLQVAVLSPQEHQPALDDADRPLEQRDEPVRHSLRGRVPWRAGNQLT